jgi:hypothetical protein
VTAAPDAKLDPKIVVLVVPVVGPKRLVMPPMRGSVVGTVVGLTVNVTLPTLVEAYPVI